MTTFLSLSIQVFHCLRHEGTGGRTLLVDGFHAADKVLQKSPSCFELLARVPIKHEYIENMEGHRNHMIGIGPVLNVYPWNNEVYMIRYGTTATFIPAWFHSGFCDCCPGGVYFSIRVVRVRILHHGFSNFLIRGF